MKKLKKQQTVTERLAELEAQRVEQLFWISEHGQTREGYIRCYGIEDGPAIHAADIKQLDEIHYHIHLVRKDAKEAK